MSDLETTRSNAEPLPAAPGAARAGGESAPTPLAALVTSHLELAALHEAFIERQTALHVRVLQLLAPERRP